MTFTRRDVDKRLLARRFVVQRWRRGERSSHRFNVVAVPRPLDEVVIM